MNQRPGVSHGWLPAVAGLILATAVAVVVARSATSFGPLVVRVEIMALVVLTLGITLGVERLVALATGPALVGAVVALGDGQDLSWGRSLLIGCLWYLAVELALASIEQRDGTRRTAAVWKRRIHEVAMVVAIAATVGTGGLIVSLIAPTRTLVIRVLVSAAVVAGLIGAVRHLTGTAPEEPA